MAESFVFAATCVLAGLLTFLSPCVLPLIPSYLCMIGGTAGNQGTKPRLVAGTASFVLGFSVVFIVLSILFSATFSLMGNAARWINWISGAVVIVLGLSLMFGFLSFLQYEKRFHVAAGTGRRGPKSFAGAFLAGAAFGAGWTPCVGPVLAGILLSAAQGGIGSAVFHLALYSAGLGLPFLAASFGLNAFLKASAAIKPHLPLIQKISGVLLVAMGVLIATGQYQRLSAFAAQWQGNLLGSQSQAAPAQPNQARDPDAAGEKDNAIPAEMANLFFAAGLSVAREGVDPPDFTLPLLGAGPLREGGTVSLSDLQGKVVFLNFWATWCPPCRIEMPSMELLHQEFADQGLVMLAVNVGEAADVVSSFVKENALTFPIALDRTGAVSTWYGVQALPTTYIIDRRGYIVSRTIGSIPWDTPEIAAVFKGLLEDSSLH